MRTEKIKPVSNDDQRPLVLLRERGVLVEYRPDGWHVDVGGLAREQAAELSRDALRILAMKAGHA